MIPLTLQIKNFLSYGAELQIIDFSAYPLICLSGKNGHGKSALLDALTWALWGQARKISGTAKADQGLVRLGQTQMMVCLDFSFANAIYRVRREFALTYGKPHAALDFALIEPDTDTVISLTDKTIRDTQKKIDDLLRLDYDAFINSAFLRQGQANEFSKKSAKERKEVLASILGLNQYENVRKLALEKARALSLEKNNIQILQEKNGHELSKIDDLKRRLVELQSVLGGYTAQEKELAIAQNACMAERKKLLDEQKNYEVLEIHYDQLHTDEQQRQEKLRTIVATWRSINRKQRLLGDYTDLEQRKKRVLDEINTHQQQLQKTLELKEQLFKHKETRHALEKKAHEVLSNQLQQHQLALERITFAHKTAMATTIDLQKKQLALTHELQTCTKEIAALQLSEQKCAAHIETYKRLEHQFEKRKSHYQKYVALGNAVTAELESIAHKQKLSQDEHNPSCPLCEQNLSAARRKFLKTQLANQEEFMQHRLQRLTRLIKSLKALLIEQHKEIDTQKKAIEQNTINTVKIEELRKTTAKIEHQLQELTANLTHNKNDETRYAQELERMEQNKKVVEQQGIAHLLASEEYVTLAAAQKALEQEALSIAYDQQKHQQTATMLRQIEQQCIEYAQLLEQVQQQHERMRNVHELCTVLKEIRSKKNQLQESLKAFAYLPSAVQAINNKEQEIGQRAHALKQQKELLLLEKGSGEHEQEKLKALEIEHKKQQQTMIQLQETIDEYQAIATATSKDGIQALLIEDAIPEIEQEANNLLAKLTNNQAQIFIESLRDLKKGGTKETLDIKISDTAGIRPYEMFSGGEAFRIDFALRIAISKLLARRAGTSLQTLIIDEGFGSQDEEGLNNIMDAIYKIQDDFAKVIIVSHLATMKEQFPVHFVIEKGPQGSGLRVVEHG